MSVLFSVGARKRQVIKHRLEIVDNNDVQLWISVSYYKAELKNVNIENQNIKLTEYLKLSIEGDLYL